MLLFNVLLLIHFIAFAAYLWILVQLWPNPAAPRDKKGLILGIILLLTGIAMVALKYPHINYFKVVPKTGLFLVVTVINAVTGDKPYTRTAYYALIVLTLLAACIAVFRV
ncbi:hypothetical protein [Chitinophaga solisilvae]|uniref:hypothetical protein n=1 Tax=Chitinophaga solisilvae TaxID=1233460 RepID=UPI00136A3A71|nr:hypothetical protein [Chitinophaga solisilvae]